jgi:hypothetical protein
MGEPFLSINVLSYHAANVFGPVLSQCPEENLDSKKKVRLELVLLLGLGIACVLGIFLFRIFLY